MTAALSPRAMRTGRGHRGGRWTPWPWRAMLGWCSRTRHPSPARIAVARGRQRTAAPDCPRRPRAVVLGSPPRTARPRPPPRPPPRSSAPSPLASGLACCPPGGEPASRGHTPQKRARHRSWDRSSRVGTWPRITTVSPELSDPANCRNARARRRAQRPRCAAKSCRVPAPAAWHRSCLWGTTGRHPQEANDEADGSGGRGARSDGDDG
jgi:hypothetical protein